MTRWGARQGCYAGVGFAENLPEPQRTARSPSVAAIPDDQAHAPSRPCPSQTPPSAGANTAASEPSDCMMPRAVPCSRAEADWLTRLVSAGRSTPVLNAYTLATTSNEPVPWANGRPK